MILVGFVVDVKGKNLVFNVKHKFGGRKNGVILHDLKAHDNHRHSRMLTALDFKLGGNGLPTDAALVPFFSSVVFVFNSICLCLSCGNRFL